MNKTNSRTKAADVVDDVIAEASAKAKRARASATRTAHKVDDVARDGISRASDIVEDLRDRDLVDEVRDAVRRHPAAALIGAAVAGAALSHLVLRSARR